ncbi:MAG: hypothetical protein LBC40_09590, partial [Dysgonamonadaceae bacterium]|nr:hypothetical protein [Dysgonamonadaceae bacterium]
MTNLIGGSAAFIADAAVQVGSTVAGKGYVIQATAFLYQLDWNEETSYKFYDKCYNANNLSTFYDSLEIKLKYLGSESKWADIQSTIFSKRTEEELVQRATVRAIDAAIAKLQRKYET